MELHPYLLAGLILVALWPWLIAPNLRRRAREFRGCRFAHRGLHAAGIDENSIEAFARACEAGVGIELDVLLTRDRQAAVFHDLNLKRLLGVDARVGACDMAQLGALRLPAGGRIPELGEALRAIDGRVPLLVEVKTCRGSFALCAAVRARLRAYPGAFMVQSFNPLILFWFRLHAPGFRRGLLVSTPIGPGAPLRRLSCCLLGSFLLNVLARPDYIAHEYGAGECAGLRAVRRLYRPQEALWTLRDARIERELRARGDITIFEGFVPRA